MGLRYTKEDFFASFRKLEQKNPPQSLKVIVDRDINDWQLSVFGRPSIEALKLSPDTPSSIGQGYPFLNKAKLINQILSPDDDLYSIK